MRRANPPLGAWCQVVGKIETGKTAWRAALRELHEETGLVPDALYSADTFELFYEARIDSMTLAPCFVAIVSVDAEPRSDSEHDMAEWLGPEEAIARVSFAGQRRVLREIADGFMARAPHPDLRIAFQ